MTSIARLATPAPDHRLREAIVTVTGAARVPLPYTTVVVTRLNHPFLPTDMRYHTEN
jgi:hypothetical protein